jgi:formylglycine-generating enzyme required for sulfatase activity
MNTIPHNGIDIEIYEVFHDRLASDAKDGEGPAMVCLPGGTFLMGDEKGRDNEKPVHAVRLDAFAMGRAPVTWGEYRLFCEGIQGHWPEWLEQGSEYNLETGKNDYYRQRGVNRAALDLSVVGISWEDARAYCLWLSEQTGESYALPTEAQWEYACRAGNPGRWCFGDDERKLAEYAWFSGNAGGRLHPVRLHPVMNKAANNFGLYDVHGNVWEWCADWYSQDYYQQFTSKPQHTASASEQSASGSASENPSGPASGSERVVRGGSWSYDAVICRSAFRDCFDPACRCRTLGFRLSRRRE